MTPRLAERPSGFSTQGYGARCAAASGPSANVDAEELRHRADRPPEKAAARDTCRGRRAPRRRMERNSERCGHLGRQHRGRISDRRDRVERRPRKRFERRRQVAKPHWDRAVAPRILEHMAAIRRQRQIHAQPVARPPRKRGSGSRWSPRTAAGAPRVNPPSGRIPWCADCKPNGIPARRPASAPAHPDPETAWRA